MTLGKHWVYGDNEDIVLSSLKGLVHSNPAIKLIPSEKVVFNKNTDGNNKVTLISGGGSGHEPLHAGFVGDNLLDAAVSGSIFASPSTKQIMAAVKEKSDKKNGTLIICKNYTGDVLHFGLVAERAKSEGYNVEILAVADDVAVGRTQNKMVGRRGLAGTALIHKILGAASAEGSDLSSTFELGKAVNESLVTLGASLDRTSVPGKGQSDVEFTRENEAEIGLGIHNEPGHKVSPIPNIDELIKKMLQMLFSSEDSERHYVDFDLKNDETVLLVNNIGGTSSLELYAIVSHVVENLPLAKRPKRILVSDFVTSLNSPGFSVTFLNLTAAVKLNKKFSESKLLSFIDKETNASGWKPKSFKGEEWNVQNQYVESPMKDAQTLTSSLRMDPEKFQKNLTSALEALLKAEPLVTHYDTIVGDGDCGETLAGGAHSILNAFKEEKNFKNHLNDPVATLSRITELVEDSMGGTSGGIYSIYLTALVKNFQSTKELKLKTVSDAMYKALYDGLFMYTKARIGGRTLVDTIQPFLDTLRETNDLYKALESAKKGCEHTKELQAKFGRASYVDEKELKEEGGIPDPGAYGLLSLLEGYINSLR